MADYNFGFLKHSIEMGKHADANIKLGPVGDGSSFMNHDFTSIVHNADRIQTIYSNDRDFIWGQKWGNAESKVAE